MRYAGLLVATVALALVAGCTGADDSDTAPPATTPTPTPAPISTPTPAPIPTPTPTATTPTYRQPPGPLRVARGQTRPGTRLRFGQRAVVPIRGRPLYGSYRDGVVGIVVGSIRRTAGRNVTGNFDAKSRSVLAGATAYYAPITITNLSGNDLSIFTNPSFDGRRRGGGEPDVALIGGSLPGCTSDPSPSTFDRRGAVWRTCVIAVSRSSRIREVHYRNAPYGTETQLFDEPPPKYNRFYGLGDIVWR